MKSKHTTSSRKTILVLAPLLAVASLLVLLAVFLKNNQQPLFKDRKDVAIVYTLKGGVVGFCDYLEITKTGNYVYKETCGSEKTVEGKLNYEDTKKLGSLVSGCGYFDNTSRSQVTDGLFVSLIFYGENKESRDSDCGVVSIFPNEMLWKIKANLINTVPDDPLLQGISPCGLKLSLPSSWVVGTVEDIKPFPNEGITYEASLNKQQFEVLNETHQKQLDILCFQVITKEKLSVEESIELLKPTSGLLDFKNAKFDIFPVNNKVCSHFDQWDFPTVICNTPSGTDCGVGPEAIKVKDVFICPKDGDKQTGAFIYEIVKHHQNSAEGNTLLDRVFNTITF